MISDFTGKCECNETEITSDSSHFCLLAHGIDSEMELIFEQADGPSTTPRSTPIVGRVCTSQGETFAHMVDAWVGRDPGEWFDACDAVQRIVVWCGRVGASVDPDGDDSEAQAARLLASWSQAGWAQFDEDVVKLDEFVSRAGLELLIRPSCSGMLSDAICTAAWARRSSGLACKLMLDPMGWMVGSMMRDVGDHLGRIADLCEECVETSQKVGAVLIRSLKTDESGELVQCPVGEGEIDPALIVDRFGGLIRLGQDRGIPLIVLDRGDLELLGL